MSVVSNIMCVPPRDHIDDILAQHTASPGHISSVYISQKTSVDVPEKSNTVSFIVRVSHSECCLVMLSLSYHRRLRMISEALDPSVEGGRVSHNWCMCVVSHGYGGLCGGRDGVVDGMQGDKAKGVCRMSADAAVHTESEVKTLIPSLYKCVCLGRVEPESVCLPGKALTWQATRRLRFVIHAVSWLHSMVLHRCAW